LVPENEVGKLLSTWELERNNAILTTLRVGPEKIVRMGIVELDGKWVTNIVEKPTLEEAPSDMGSPPLYCYTTKILDYLSEIQPSPRGEYELQDAIKMLIKRDGKVSAFPLTGRVDLTTPDDLLALNLHYLSNGIPQTEIRTKTIGNNTRFTGPVYIDEGVRIGANCMIGPNVFLESGCVLEDHVCLENTIVLRGRRITSGAQLKNQVVY